LKTIGILNRERYIKLFAVIGILLLCVLIILIIENILLSFVFASVTYYLLAPIVNAIERAGISRRLGVAGLFLCIVFVFLMGVYILLPAITSQISAFKDELPTFIDGITKLASVTEQKLNAISYNLYHIDTSKSVEAALSTFSRRVFEDLPDLISSSMAVLVLAPFFAFFMLLDGQAVTKQIMSLVPNNFFEFALNLQHQMNVQLGDFIRARLLEAGLVGTVVWLGLTIIGFPYAVLLGAFGGLTNLIPYIGPIIGAVPAILIAVVNEASGLEMLILVGVYVVAQLIDNFLIIPLMVAKIVNLHPVTVVIVIIIGAQLAGILGMIISIPVACILKLTAVEIYRHLVEFHT
jgi:putative permease